LGNRRWRGTKAFTAKNPPYGALLSYYLKEAMPAETPKKDGEEKIERRGRGEIEDRHERRRRRKEGRQSKNHGTRQRRKVIREMDGPAAVGVNRTNWDLRFNPPAEPTPEQQEASSGSL